MRFLIYLFWNIFETLLRFIPLPSKIGWIPIGDPGPDSPVFLTCNFHLSVIRVKHALRKINAHLLVADSRGINVWCAAAGGHLTNHDVISVLKTSGIADRVNHRRVILPQLAAAGIEAKIISTRTGWTVIWGPVYARDIPSFLKNKRIKRPSMRDVRFHFVQRMEMAAAWAFSVSVVSSAVLFFVWREAVFPVAGFIWVLAVTVFALFPIYSVLQRSRLGRIGIFIVFLGACLGGLVLVSFLGGDTTWKFYLTWGSVLALIVLILTCDIPGSTPVLKSQFHDEKFYQVVLDSDKCRGAAFCEDVCPRNCFDVDNENRVALLTGIHRCVRCSACIVQCPFDALTFQSPSGDILSPERIRRQKLSLSGKRSLKRK